MKFEVIEDKVQMGHRGYIRHKLNDMPEGELVQKCVVCGEIINDYHGDENIIWFSDNEKHPPKGMSAGYVFVSVEKNPSTIIHELLAQLGAKMPEDFIDCSIINS